MTGLRSLLFNIYLFASQVPLLLLLWLLVPMPGGVLRGVRWWTRGSQWVLKHVVGLGLEVRGLERLPPGPWVLASKHQSAWETFAYHFLFDRMVYVLKMELMRIPLWGFYARQCRSIGVDRAGGGAALKRMLREVEQRLEDGHPVVIFPEGTRSAPGQRQPYHPGIAGVYGRTAYPVVPVALNSGVFWGRRSFKKYPGTVVVEFLEPMPKGLKRQEFLAELERRIETASNALVDEARRQLPPDAPLALAHETSADRTLTEKS